MPQSSSDGSRQRAVILQRMAAAAAPSTHARLLAVSKTQSVDAIRVLAEAGQHSFGENYVQEAARKREALAELGLEWHLIGTLQSNKCQLAARTFDWIQTVDRTKLIAPLAQARAGIEGRLQLLVQVNVDDEASKSGCKPDQIEDLAERIAREPALQLRGLMAIPAPHADPELRRPAFARMRELFVALSARHAEVDTLSMGMSDDFEIALAEGATLVRIGTALFGARAASGGA